jgi:hypothetical protein
MLERSAPATWLNSLSSKGKPAALGKGVAHWSGAVASRLGSRGVNVWGRFIVIEDAPACPDEVVVSASQAQLDKEMTTKFSSAFR